MENGVYIVTVQFTLLKKKKTVIINASNDRYHAFRKKNRKRYGTVNGDLLKRQTPKKIAGGYGTVGVTNSDAPLYF